ncbi:MAG: energy-coupling factor transporter ATPase [Bacilli bacterium]|nr:energy-coupling factor transporter ATPase [Bacilli bacterium]
MSIKISRLSFDYLPKTNNTVHALHDVSCEIKGKSITAIVGHTGSGKSTLIQTLNALILPSSGEVVVDDFVITSKKKKNKQIKELRKHIAVVFQFPEYQLFEETIEKDVAFGLKNYGMKEPEAIEEAHKALSMVGIDESFYKRSPLELSGGEKRRVAIAGILVLNPDILVLDEPTAGLDPEGMNMVMDLIHTLNEQGKTIIIVSHDMELVLNIATDVIVLNDGKIVYQGNPQSLFELDAKELSLEIPQLYLFAKELIKKGLNINISNIRDIPSLFKEIERVRK